MYFRFLGLFNIKKGIYESTVQEIEDKTTNKASKQTKMYQKHIKGIVHPK